MIFNNDWFEFNNLTFLSIPGITERVLTLQPRKMKEGSLVKRTVYAKVLSVNLKWTKTTIYIETTSRIG